jgi:hypothetical protein
MLRFLVALAAAVACSACTGPCLQLAGKICDCQSTSTLRDQCNQQANDTKSQVNITGDDDARCQQLLTRCDCHALDTEQGKVECGLARDPGWTVPGLDAG